MPAVKLTIRTIANCLMLPNLLVLRDWDLCEIELTINAGRVAVVRTLHAPHKERIWGHFIDGMGLAM